ncbi:DUF2334 domain-containing protein [Butyrivibrio sp. CB08]|uniref:DUF2334 domain-containing protein n=1 Tax=Butyrivibrio sp. CB08 TaxID=2364879 RepID=UPI000EA9D90B|nr:DUF2334 domain-containing protein [Butyrivibrio sp. CB08]RKM59809.1 DUF2334 domain-containing protein [Butyrivibrio sp. CB08]
MKITIRMDDITPDMDWNKFKKFKNLLDEHDIKPLIGVVPENRDRNLSKTEPREGFWNYVKELQEHGWIVAMHGYNHVYTTKKAGMFPVGDKSEFAGLSYDRQYEMIKEGKQTLKARGIVTDIFMAPSHSFDKNTLRALKENGFYIVTDGFGIAPFRQHGLVFYPISVNKRKSFEDTRDGIVTFVYHANTMNDKDFDKLEKLLLSGKVVSYTEYKRLEIQDRNIYESLGQYLTARAKYTFLHLRKIRG